MSTGPEDLKIDHGKLAEIANSYGLAFIALFGSYAKGRHVPGSDVDVAAMIAPEAAVGGWRESWADCEMALFDQLGQAIAAPEGIDLVVLNRASALLLFQVARHGRALYERTAGAFPRFKSYATRRYDNDRKYFRRREQYLKRRCEQWNTEIKSSRS